MEVKTLTREGNTLRILIQDVDVAYVNALRRIMIAEVPSMAIDEALIIENSSVLHDEVLAHRLALIPLKTDLDKYVLPEECTCGSELGCSNCRVSLTLDVEATDTPITVYAKDLKSEDPEIVPVYPDMPIVKLAPGQKIKLEAYARLGRGRDHAKWQPVSVCAHKYLPIIRFDEKRCGACGDCVDVCPRKILVKIDQYIRVTDLTECTLCLDCVRACKLEPPAMDVSWDERSFILHIESVGGLSPERILQEATKILDKKLEEFSQELEKQLEVLAK